MLPFSFVSGLLDKFMQVNNNRLYTMRANLHMNFKGRGTPFRGYIVKYRIIKALWRRKKTGKNVVIVLSKNILVGRCLGQHL